MSFSEIPDIRIRMQSHHCPRCGRRFTVPQDVGARYRCPVCTDCYMECETCFID